MKARAYLDRRPLAGHPYLSQLTEDVVLLEHPEPLWHALRGWLYELSPEGSEALFATTAQTDLLLVPAGAVRLVIESEQESRAELAQRGELSRRRLRYPGSPGGGAPSWCWLYVLLPGHVVLVTEPDAPDSGNSVTNCCEYLAWAVSQVLDIPLSALRWVETYEQRPAPRALIAGWGEKDQAFFRQRADGTLEMDESLGTGWRRIKDASPAQLPPSVTLLEGRCETQQALLSVLAQRAERLASAQTFLLLYSTGDGQAHLAAAQQQLAARRGRSGDTV